MVTEEKGALSDEDLYNVIGWFVRARKKIPLIGWYTRDDLIQDMFMDIKKYSHEQVSNQSMHWAMCRCLKKRNRIHRSDLTSSYDDFTEDDDNHVPYIDRLGEYHSPEVEAKVDFQLIAALSEGRDELVIDYFLKGMTMEEIAEKKGITRQGVNNAVQRAVKIIKRNLEALGEEHLAEEAFTATGKRKTI